MDAKGEAYLAWLEATQNFSPAPTAEEESTTAQDSTPVPMPIPWVGYPWISATTSLKDYLKSYLWATAGIGLALLGVFGLMLAWSGLCWFVNGGIRGAW